MLERNLRAGSITLSERKCCLGSKAWKNLSKGVENAPFKMVYGSFL